MARFGFKSVFSKLFASVVLTLVLFAVAMITLMNVVHNNSADARWEVLAKQIVSQVDPFVDELDNATTMEELLQVRFMLAVIKKSFDIFDESLQAKMGLYDRDGLLLIQTEDSDLPKTLPEDPSFISRMLPAFFSTDKVNVQAMSDRGYTLLYEPRNPPKRSELWAVLNLFTGTLILLALMSGVLWWIARSMTWRINQMSRQMAQLGEGNFSVRVPAKGTDEIASLAKGFNQAAQKIEQLINANNLLLAHASHELRTPITRIRLQIEMMDMLSNELSDGTRAKFQKRAQAVNRDLTGLNDLVESILLVSRLDAGHAAQSNETLDLYDLVHQECQHYPEATLYGKSLMIEGQPKLLIHLIRNLLNNALIHGEPPIDVHVYGVLKREDAFYPPQEMLAVAPKEAQEDEDAHSTDTDSADTVTDAEIIPESTIDITTESNDTSSDAANDDAQSSTDTDSHSDAASADDCSQDEKQVDESVSEKPSKDAKAAKKSRSESNMNMLNDIGFAKRLRRPKVDTVPEPNFAVLSVIDQGKGIPLDKRQEIFSPFVRLQQQKKGSGLGLSLVAQIVEAHHGHIRTDTYNGRTRFIVTLPVNAQAIDNDNEI